MKRITFDRLVMLGHRLTFSLMKSGARVGIKKYKELTEGFSNNDTDWKETKMTMEKYFIPENRAAEEWLESGSGKTYLDVGAGSGRFVKRAFERGASHVTATDIIDGCIEYLESLKTTWPSLEVRKLNARSMEEFTDGQFDRAMLLGNALGGMYDCWKDGETSFQLEVIREILRIAREEICITVQRPGSFRMMLESYRLNKIQVYDYESASGIKRMRETRQDGVCEYRSQHFRKEQIEGLLKQASVREEQYEIKPINEMNWIVIIKKNKQI